MVYRNAQFYDEVSPQFLLPAVREVCRLRVSASEWEQDDAMIKLDKSTQDAANRIWEKGRQRQEEIRNFVDENLSKVAQEPQAVPAIAAAFKRKRKAIEAEVARSQLEHGEAAELADEDSNDDNAKEPGET